MSDEILTALDGKAVRDTDGRWYWRGGGTPVDGASDMTLSDLYPDLVITTGHVLVPDVLVRDAPELAWVRDEAQGPTNAYDREGARSGLPTAGWGTRFDRGPRRLAPSRRPQGSRLRADLRRQVPAGRCVTTTSASSPFRQSPRHSASASAVSTEA